MRPGTTHHERYGSLTAAQTTALAIPASRGELLPYPFDEATPADRKVLVALEQGAWVLHCARLSLEGDR